MSLVQYGGGVVDARGSVGGTVMSRSKGGATHKAKISPLQPTSEKTSQNRALLAAVSQFWNSQITAANRAAWNQFATITPSTNIFGLTKYLSGHQWFTRVNVNGIGAGFPMKALPPTSGSTMGVTSLAVTATSAGIGNLSIVYTTPSGFPLDWIMLYVTVPISAGISYVNNQLRLLTVSGVASFTMDLTAGYEAKFANIANYQGKQIFVFAAGFDGVNYVTSSFYAGSAIIA